MLGMCRTGSTCNLAVTQNSYFIYWEIKLSCIPISTILIIWEITLITAMDNVNLSISPALQGTGISLSEPRMSDVKVVTLEEVETEMNNVNLSENSALQNTDVNSSEKHEEEWDIEHIREESDFGENIDLKVNFDEVESPSDTHKEKAEIEVLKYFIANHDLTEPKKVAHFCSKITELDKLVKLAKLRKCSEQGLLPDIPDYFIEKCISTTERRVAMDTIYAGPNITRRADAVHAWVSKPKSFKLKEIEGKVLPNGRAIWEKHEVSRFFKIPLNVKFKPQRKPSVNQWNPTVGRNWILTWANQLKKTVIDKGPSYAVLGNSFAQRLYNKPAPDLHKAEIRKMISGAQLYVSLMDETTRKTPTVRTLASYMPDSIKKKVILYFGEEPITISNLSKLELEFKKHKPIFRRIVSHVNGESTEDLSQLQSSISQVYAEKHYIKPLRIFGEEMNVANFDEYLQHLSPIDYGLVTRYFSNDKKISVKELQRRLSQYTLKQQMFSQEDRNRYLPPSFVFNTDGTYLELVIDTFSALSEHFQGISWKQGAQMCAFLTALTQQTTMLGIVSVISQFVIPDCEFWWNAMKEKLRYAYEAYKRTFTPVKVYQQSDGEMVATLWEKISSVTHEFGRILWECVASVIIYTIGDSFLPEELWNTFKNSRTLEALIKGLRAELMKQSIKTMAESILSTIKSFLGTFKKCIDQKSLAPLYSSAIDPIDWKFRANAIRVYYTEIMLIAGQAYDTRRFDKLREDGNIPSDWLVPFTPAALSEYVDWLVEEGNTIQTYLNHNRTLQNDIRNELVHLNSIREANSCGYGITQPRVQPFSAMLVGPAGSGKTNLSHEIYQAIGRANGYPIDAANRYSWQPGANFQDGFGPSQWAVGLDDIDQSTAQPQAGVENHVQIGIKLINNEPLSIEQSRVEMKGKVAPKPLLVIMTSNFEQGRLKSFSLVPQAFYRRFPFWIKVKAKPEYDNGTGGIDKNKIQDCMDGELYELTVQRYNPISGDFPYEEIPHIKTKSALFRFLLVEYRKHIDQQLAFLSKTVAREYCPHCFVTLNSDGTGCSCFREVPEQVLVNPAFKIKEQMLDEYSEYDQASLSQYSLVALPLAIAGFGFAYRKISNSVVQIQNKVITASDSIIELAAKAKIYEAKYAMTVTDFTRRYNRAIAWVPTESQILCVVSGIVALGYILTKYKSRNQALEHNAVPGFVNSGWVRVPQEFTPGLPLQGSTFTKEEAIKQIRENYVKIERKGVGQVFGVAITPNMVLTVLHIVSSTGEVPQETTGEITVYQDGMPHYIDINAFNMTKIANDAILIKVPGLAGLTGCYKKFWPAFDTSVSQFDEAILIRDVTDSYIDASLTTVAHNKCLKSSQAQTKDGECGLVYLVKMNRGWKAVAIHNMLMENHLGNTTSFGVLVASDMFKAGVERLGARLQVGRIPLKQTGLNYDKQVYDHYPSKSEILVAISQYDVQVKPIGTATIQVHGSTIKTGVKPTIFHKEFKDLEEEFCGEADYWEKPNFKGMMKDDKWWSPYIASLIPLKRGRRRMEYLMLSLAEYLHNVKNLQLDGYEQISLEEAIIGIPGSVIQSVDLKTSVGMPFSKPKKHFIQIYDRQAYADPSLCQVREEYEEILKDGDIPFPISLCMLKDEAISKEKNAKRKARVFNCLPFSYNWIMKSRLAPIESLMRFNRSCFGSMVGVNMTSLECNEVVRILRRTDPNLERLIDLDIASQDKSEDGVMIDLVSIVFMCLMQHMGYDGHDAYTLIQGLRNTIYVIKNDFYILGATNPSGNDKTVTINDVINSIMHHYFYYRMKYPDGLPSKLNKLLIDYQRSLIYNKGDVTAELETYLTFDYHCSKVTYGDDSIISVSSSCTFYDPLKIPTLGLECGFVYTDSNKTNIIEWKKLSEIQFLKRKFVFRDDLGVYVGCLSLKSIAKMLVMAKKSSLTEKDHGAALLSDVVREMAYYSRDEFTRVYDRIMHVAEMYNLKDNGYFMVKTYDEYVQIMKDGSFSAWSEPNLA
jgi:hypothetical protein